MDLHIKCKTVKLRKEKHRRKSLRSRPKERVLRLGPKSTIDKRKN